MKYFADIDGETFELSKIHHDGHVSSAARHFSGLLPNGQRVAATRVVEYKSNPSKHACSSKCLNATGKLKCECSCGGKNHGRG